MLIQELLAFLLAVATNWLAVVGVVSTVLWVVAQTFGSRDGGLLKNPRLWAWLAICFLFLATFEAWRQEHAQVAAGPSVAIVSSEGVILSQKNFSQYGLAVEKRQEKRPESSFAWNVYILTFEREPEHFTVRTDEGATPFRNKIGPRQYRVGFVGVGFGNPVVDVNFRVEAD
jgi:hypothetical protein